MHTRMINEPKNYDYDHMPSSVTSNPSHKHKPHPSNRSQFRKRQKLDTSASAYWDNLSKIWLTKDALEELDRRNSHLKPPQNLHRPITRCFHTELKKKHCNPFQFAPTFLHDCAPTCSKQIKRVSRLGGPDLTDLRNYPKPESFLEKAMSSRSRSRKRRPGSPPSASTDTRGTTKSTSTTPYNRNFQQNLIDHGVYPDGYEYPDGRIPVMPNNWEEINETLARPRSSLSPSKFSDEHFQKFKRADTHASKEQPVTTSVIPIIEGDVDDPKCTGGGYLLGNLAPLTDGTLAQAKPDHFYGARPEQLNRRIRNELCNYIIPSTQDDLPMIPNFFLEAKGPDGSLAVATQQACYDGALGARGMHTLQSYQQDRSTYDNSAYTLTSTYHGGQLKLYTTHLTEPEGPGHRPEYIMTQLNTWGMTGNLETFRQGACAYRNARDWAKEKRDGFIRLANERCPDAKSQQHCASQRGTATDEAVTLDDSDVSTVFDEGAHQDVQWSFTTPVEDADEESLSRMPKKPRLNASVSFGGTVDRITSHPN
ncbi:hypothetical protein BDDG_13161 [Blastomyces dermatitidis ATCC 18188]|uniref:Uncharacterized protein n=1 Tax=Ajellomyces dermatitidis (strain ATCC 18188 / CBS 674.68) TaxID=653446 RepID=A0A0J9HIF8_AJEDA|nr:hypothetical protein BDDG_13161 [Blastomyces dermatitidis ATCC 18188]